MSDKMQEPLNAPPPTGSVGIPPIQKSELLDEEELARQELARITPSNEELRKIAAKCGPLPKWLDEGDEEMPFNPIED